MTRAASGAGWLENGYRVHTRGDTRMREHREVAERALGKPLPRFAVVHHVDENRLNNDPSNLVICPDNKYHKLLHMRMDAMREAGDPNFRRCTFCKTYDDPKNMRGEKSGRFVHAKCSAETKKLTRHAKFGLPETVESRALDASGHADWRKCWICKTYSDPTLMNRLVRKNGTGYFYHGACHKARSAENYRKRKLEEAI